MMARAMVLQVAAVALAFALITAYHVAPKTAAMSGKARPDLGVSEVVTCCWDELDTAAGGYVELFVGDYHDTTSFNLDIYEYPGGVQPVASALGQHPTQGHSWLRFPVATASGSSFTKGKKYEFRFTRSGSDSIHYYYDTACGYNYGQMIAPYPPSITPSYGLAMRVYGRMTPVDSTYWGMVPELPWDPDPLKRAWRDSMRTAGVGLARLEIDWNQVQPDSPTGYSFDRTDDQLEWIQDSAKCEVFAVLTRCPKWASSRREWKQLEGSPDSWYWDTVPYCAPRNLWPRPESTNYWAQWLDTLVEHVGNRIQVWEIWNEPNDTCIDPAKSFTGWWRRPNMDSAYPGLGEQERGSVRCTSGSARSPTASSSTRTGTRMTAS